LDNFRNYLVFAGRPDKIILNDSKGFRGFTGKNPVERCQNRAEGLGRKAFFCRYRYTIIPNRKLLDAFNKNQIGNFVYQFV